MERLKVTKTFGLFSFPDLFYYQSSVEKWKPIPDKNFNFISQEYFPKVSTKQEILFPKFIL